MPSSARVISPVLPFPSKVRSVDLVTFSTENKNTNSHLFKINIQYLHEFIIFHLYLSKIII